MFRKLSYYLYILSAITIIGCATQGRPNGGPKDAIPPQVVEAESTKNYQTNFTDREFEIQFDEFIKVSNVTKEVLISPPMLNFPEITSKGKTLKVKFNPKEEIKENATYTINFGQSIADYTEGNKLQNFSFVFATGDVIDSLSIQGSVKDFKTGKEVENVVILLYDNLEDSIIYKERPFYFAKTAKDGSFKLNNLKSDTFQIFALEDQNLNYFYNPESESIAFIDSTFELTDSSKLSFDFKLATMVAPLAVESKTTDNYGKLSFKLTAPVSDLKYEILDSLDHYDILAQDSLHIWYKDFRDSTLHINILEDSLSIRLRKFKLDTLRNTPKMHKQNATKQSAIPPKEWVDITLNTPIINLNRDRINVIDTSGTMLDFKFEIDSTDQRILKLKASWKENESYEINILPQAITNFYGLQNDSIKVTAVISELAKFGNLYPQMINMDSTQQYVIRLMQAEKLIKTDIIVNKSKEQLSYTNLKPGKYKLQIVEDRNKNKKWDSADYNSKAFPEPFIEVELPELRANWEDDSEFDISKILKQ